MRKGAAVTLDDRGLPEGYPFQADWEVTPRDVRAMLDRGEVAVLLDVRLAREVAAASIDGATHLPMQEVPARLEELEDHLDDRVVVF